VAQRTCGRDDCGKPHYARNMCKAHYRQEWSKGNLKPLVVRATNRIYALDEHYFDQIDTPEKAYWLGFIAADGYISDRGYLSIALASIDAGHLEKFRAAVGSTAPIKRSLNPLKGRRYPRVRLTLYSAHLTRALGREGIFPRKSLTLEPWGGPDNLMPHYWRGVIDGDGTLGIGPTWWVGLVGTRALVDAFRAWVQGFLPSASAAPRQIGNIWCLKFGGRMTCRTIALALYQDSPVALDRKGALAVALMATASIDGRSSLEHRAAMAAARLGVKIPNANRATHRTPEFREAARQRATGRKASPEARRKRSESMRRAHALRTPEMKAAISAKISQSKLAPTVRAPDQETLW
jgi:hypothetical protein